MIDILVVSRNYELRSLKRLVPWRKHTVSGFIPICARTSAALSRKFLVSGVPDVTKPEYLSVSKRIIDRLSVDDKLRRQPRELLRSRSDDPLVRLQLVLDRRPRAVPRTASLKVPVQLPRLDPLVDRSATHPKPPRQLRLRYTPFPIVLQQHPCLPSVHRCSAPFLLIVPTAWTGTLTPAINVCSFRLPRMGDLQLSATPAREDRGADGGAGFLARALKW